jgi:coenzyme F420 hydrogenase subunit beta
VTIVRTQRGADWLRGAADAGAIQLRPGEEDPTAIALLAKLAAKSRQRVLGRPGRPTVGQDPVMMPGAMSAMGRTGEGPWTLRRTTAS